MELPAGPFEVILADPPWRYERAITTVGQHVEQHYPTMTLEEICALPVKTIAAKSAILFLWTTPPKLEDAFMVIRAWGFRYRTNVVWCKLTPTGKQNSGMGYYVRGDHEHVLVADQGDHEHVLLAIKGSPGVPHPMDRPHSWFPSPRGRHSKKPPEVHEAIEKMYPVKTKIELFARTLREGWTVWGNEV